MRKLAIATLTALAAMSMSGMAKAGSYDDDYSGYQDDGYNHKKYVKHCYYKKVKWYDDYGYVHYKRVKICE